MLTGRQVHLRAIFALAIPAFLFFGTRLFDLDTLYALIVSDWAAMLLAIGVLTGLVILEFRYTAVLLRLCRVRGNRGAYLAAEPGPEELARRRCWKYKVVTVVLSTVLSLGLAELTLRVFSIQPPAALPNYVAESGLVDNTTNALGIREKWDTLSEDDARLRVAFLGDSITYAYGVEQSQSFCHLVEGLLSDDVPDGVITINLGLPATNPRVQREVYLSLREELSPDLVIHVLYLNDLSIDLDPLLRRIYRVRDEELRFSGRSYLLRFAERQVRFWLARKYARDYFRGGVSHKERQTRLTRLKADVLKCRLAVEKGGASYSLVLFPVLAELDNYPFGEVHDALNRFASSQDLPYLDLLDVFSGRNATALRVSIANEHPNAEGHRIAATAIARHLRDKVIPLLRAPPH